MSRHLRIVFVCSGNICRSPMAEAIANQLLDERDVPAAIISAGTLGISGRKPASNSLRALKERGIEPPGTLSQGLSKPLLQHADHVVVMAPKHEAHLREELGLEPDRIVRLWEFADRPLTEIEDPVGENLEAFRQTRDLLYECVTNWFDELLDEQA